MIKQRAPVMDSKTKSELLDWLRSYRASAGEERRRLGQQVEAFTAALSGLEEQVWLAALLDHAKDQVPLSTVASRADLAVAEIRSIMLASSS